MEAIILGSGTSQGVPVIGCTCKICQSDNEKDKRLRSSLLLKTGELNILIDAGPDFRQQMLREKIDKLDAIVFTHEHRDHIGGLDDVRAFNFRTHEPMQVYAEKRVEDFIRKEYSYAFTNTSYPGIPKLNFNTINENPFQISNIKITPIRAMHSKLPVLGFRIGDLTYLTDLNSISDKELKKIIGSETLIIDALRTKPHTSHFCLDEALQVIKQCNPEKAYLTHISHYLGLHNEMNTQLPENIKLAYDGMKLTFNL